MKYNKYNWYPGYDDELIDPPTIADKIAQIINKYMQPSTEEQKKYKIPLLNEESAEAWGLSKLDHALYLMHKKELAQRNEDKLQNKINKILSNDIKTQCQTGRGDYWYFRRAELIKLLRGKAKTITPAEARQKIQAMCDDKFLYYIKELDLYIISITYYINMHLKPELRDFFICGDGSYCFCLDVDFAKVYHDLEAHARRPVFLADLTSCGAIYKLPNTRIILFSHKILKAEKYL